MAEKNYKRRVAWVLRQRLKMGGTLTHEERQWLDEYKRANPVGRPSTFKTRPSVSDPPIGIVNRADFQEPAFQKPTLEDPPDSMVPPPLLIGPPMDDGGNGGGGGGGDGGDGDDNGPIPDFSKADDDERPDTSADEIFEKQGAALADKYCEAIKIVGRRVTALGGFAIPEEIVDTALNFAAKGVFTRYAKKAGQMLSEETQERVVVIAGVGMYAQEFLLRRYRDKNPLTPAATAGASSNGGNGGNGASRPKTVIDVPTVRGTGLRAEG